MLAWCLLSVLIINLTSGARTATGALCSDDFGSGAAQTIHHRRARACIKDAFDDNDRHAALIHLAQRYGPQALALEPIVFTEDFAATNFPSVEPGPGHLAMIRQVVELYDQFVAPAAPATGAAADLLALIRTLDLDGYVTLIEQLRAEDRDDPTLFGRRWPVQHLRDILRR